MSSDRPIRVFVLDDSPLAIEVISRALQRDPRLQLAGVETTPTRALARLADLAVDVVCTDFYMPTMDGLAFIRCLMDVHPLPVIVVSVVTRERDAGTLFGLIAAGALDVVAKPRSCDEIEFARFAAELTDRVRVAAGVRVFRRRSAVPPRGPEGGNGDTAGETRADGPVWAVAVAASTGGPQALLELLRCLPASFPAPILCVQHISGGFLNGLVGWLDEQVGLGVRVARAGDLPDAGTAHFAPESRHLVVTAQRRMALVDEAPVGGHRPSADVLFRSVAEHYGAGAVGVILSGMGQDGVAGSREIARRGGRVYAQSAETCAVDGMPRVARETGIVDLVGSPERIARSLCRRAGA